MKEVIISLIATAGLFLTVFGFLFFLQIIGLIQ